MQMGVIVLSADEFFLSAIQTFSLFRAFSTKGGRCAGGMGVERKRRLTLRVSGLADRSRPSQVASAEEVSIICPYTIAPIKS